MTCSQSSFHAHINPLNPDFVSGFQKEDVVPLKVKEKKDQFALANTEKSTSKTPVMISVPPLLSV